MLHLSSTDPVQRIRHVEQSSIIKLEAHYESQIFNLSANLDDEGSVLMEQIKKEIGKDSKIKVWRNSKRPPFISLLDKHLTLRKQSLETGDTLMVLGGTLIGQLDRSSQLCKSSEASFSFSAPSFDMLEKIQEISTMLLSLRGQLDWSSQLCKSSGASFSFSAFSFNKLEKLEKIALERCLEKENARIYRVNSFYPFENQELISRLPGEFEGLILRGRCIKVSCDNAKIWKLVGLGKFSLQQLVSKALCPFCSSNDMIDNLGFLNCNYRIEGSLSESESCCSIEGKTERGFLSTFQDEENEKKVAWDFIEITTITLNQKELG